MPQDIYPPDAFGVTVDGGEVQMLLPNVPEGMNGVAMSPEQARYLAQCLVAMALLAETNQKRLTAQFN